MIERSWPDRPRVLCSYAYLTRDDAMPTGCDLVIDSGAFTADSKGVRIDRDAYTAFLARNAGRYTFALSLDVIGDPAASARNHAAQRAALPPSVTLLPTWHVGSPLDELERICEANDYVAIGGAVPYRSRSNALLRLMLQSHRIAERHGTKLHGLGITSARVMRLPWSSVDSSSWSIARRHPLIYLTRPGGTLRSLSRGQALSRSDEELIRLYGLNPSLVANRNATRGPGGKQLVEDYTFAMCRSYMELERWGHRPAVYLAVSVPSDIAMIRRAHDAGSPMQTPRLELTS